VVSGRGWRLEAEIKKEPRICGALRFRADDFFELLGSAAKQETLLVSLQPFSPLTPDSKDPAAHP
jgi:hypothetical protein